MGRYAAQGRVGLLARETHKHVAGAIGLVRIGPVVELVTDNLG
jgi:hypothetical protein